MTAGGGDAVSVCLLSLTGRSATTPEELNSDLGSIINPYLVDHVSSAE